MCATAQPAARLFMRWSDANAKRRWRTPSSLAVVSTKSNRRGRDRPTLAPLTPAPQSAGLFLRMPMSRFRANWTTLVVCALAPRPQTAAVPPATLRENRAPTHRFTAPRQSEAGASAVPGVPPARARCRAVRTARSWRGIVALTHLAREGRMTVTIGRRELLVALSGAAAWPLAARAQQPAMPVVAFVTPSERDSFPPRYVAAFRKGLSDTGYIEGQNVSVEYHWLEGRYDRVPALMVDLVRRQVAV